MLTVLEALNKSTQYLESKGIESARANSEIMLAHILKCKRLQLYLSFDRPLTKTEQNLCREFLQRRGNREPIQYITGNVEFYGLEFIINDTVLIPRPETEILVETILNVVDKKIDLKILDIGTGSGNIAVSLSKELPNSLITAIDISKDALKTAFENSKLNNVDKQIAFIENNVLKEQKIFKENFDVIVSNPPYVSQKDFNELEPELNKYEPSIALTDFSDGLIFYKIITENVNKLCDPGIKLFFEIGINQSDEVMRIMDKNNFRNIKIVKDYQNHDRVIWGELK